MTPNAKASCRIHFYVAYFRAPPPLLSLLLLRAASKTCETRQARKTLTYRQTVEREWGRGPGSIPGIAYNKRRQNVVAVTPHKLRRRRRHFKSVYLLLLKLKLLASWKVSFGTQTNPISSFPVSGTLPDSAGQLGSLSLVMPSTFHFI